MSPFDAARITWPTSVNPSHCGVVAGILPRFKFERADMRAKDLRLWIVGATLGATALLGGTAAASDYPPDDTTATTVPRGGEEPPTTSTERRPARHRLGEQLPR